MARLQVLHLPGADTEAARSWDAASPPPVSPFAIVLDELTDDEFDALQDEKGDLSAQLSNRPLGAVGVLAFTFPVDVV